MGQWFDWLAANWLLIVVPLLAFIAIYAIGLGLRLLLYRFFERWQGWNKWRGNKAVSETIRRPILDWFLLLGALVATQNSALDFVWRVLAGRISGSLLVVSIAWTVIITGEKLIQMYYAAAKIAQRSTSIAVNALRVTVIVIAALIVLSIWGAPVNPILLALAVILFVAGLALRDTIPSYIFGMQLSSSHQIKVGDFIKLDSGESGQVTAITWQNTQIKSLQGDSVIIPNSKLAKATVVNYGRPLKKAKNPFHFYTNLRLRELTGLKASNLTQLLTILKEVPDSVVYYHVHHFLEEHLYLTPEPTNDFAIWVNNTLGNDLLGERLASIDIFAFPSIGVVKQRLIEVIEDYLRNSPDNRQAPEEEEFNFIRSVSFILPTPYATHDLGEFVEALKLVTSDSIYFHIYEARLRLQRGTNDFSIWISDSVGEKELADKIGSIDPYIYTLENLRRRIIEEVENYIR
jgi:small-conductance mechanosensitive channel